MKSKVLLLSTILLMSMTGCSTAKDCVECTKKTLGKEVQPDSKPVVDLKKDVEPSLAMAMKGPLVITKSDVARVPAGVSTKESYQKGFCTQFELAEDTVDIETLIEDMNSCPYPSSFNEFWTTPACHAPLKNDTNVPIIFNTASDPQKNGEFPSVLHDYLVDGKKDSVTWLKAINTTTSDGYTFLDYMQYNIAKGFYSVKKDKDAALRVVTYLCQNGGQYSKYKSSVKCP